MWPMRFLGVDLAWRAATAGKQAKAAGVAGPDESGTRLNWGWTVRLQANETWSEKRAGSDTGPFMDSPPIVDNPAGHHRCTRQFRQRFVHWQFSASAVNLGSEHLDWVRLRGRTEDLVSR
jgi:hypothetical protein